jgi:PKD repeat protein
VCDGYNGNYFHFNWGWGGLYNGYFYLSALNPGTHDFNWWHAAVVGIESPLPPAADFSASTTTILPGESIDFYDLSEGCPDWWMWSFDGATPPASSVQNPTGITYSSPGTYDVSLVVGNTNGTDDTLKSAYITVSDTAMPIADFTISNSTPTLTETVYLLDSSLNAPYEWEWSFYPNSVVFLNNTDEHSQNIAVRFEAPGNYSVSLTVTNANGSDVVTRFNSISAGGLLLPFTEDFEIATWKDKWTIENSDLGITWDGYYKLSGNLPSRKAAWMYFYGYPTVGERDRLISPLINLSSYDTATLSFRHAYAIYNTTRKDSLIISISIDNGNGWERIFAATDDGYGSFATHPPTTEEFIPTEPEDWSGVGYGADPIVIDLSPWIGNANVKIMFESYNGHGNSLYIDDLMITSTNYPPMILWFEPPVTELAVSSDTTITFALEACDANDEVTYSWLLNGEEQGIEDSLYTFTFVEPGEYEIQAIASDGEYEVPVIWNVEVLPDVGIDPPYPSSITMLKPNHPNPFQSNTTISYFIAKPQKVRIQVYNIRGQLVAELLDDIQDAGEHKVSWCPDNMSSGIYFYRLETPTKSFVKKMVLIK